MVFDYDINESKWKYENGLFYSSLTDETYKMVNGVPIEIMRGYRGYYYKDDKRYIWYPKNIGYVVPF